MPSKILVTGGAGQLARALVALDPSIDAPAKAQLDVCNYDSMDTYCQAQPPAIVIHAAAVTNKFNESVDDDYIRTNIVGTANVVLWCKRHNVRLVYISTDYVYPGARGDYSEDAVLFPVNRYAKSKLGGEMAVQLYDNALIIRTSFYSTMTFSKACTDQFTSRLSVQEAAKAIYHLAVQTSRRGIINVGSRSKRSLYEIVKTEFNSKVEACQRKEIQVPYRLPPDASLNTSQCYSLLPSSERPSMTRTTCRVCGSKRLYQYLDLGVTPLANSYLTAEELQQPEFKEELAIQLCEACGLSQLSKVVNPDRMFRHYLYVSSTTQTFREHCAELAQTTAAFCEARPGDWVLDIASNDGCLLSRFRERGFNVVGVDPAENLAAEANRAGITTLCAYWSTGIANDLTSRFAAPKIVTATNVLAHVDDVHGFVAAVSHSLAPHGIFVIECPYLLTFIEHNEFDTAYHEHLSYLSVHAIKALVTQHGLHVVDVAYFPDLHGGTIRVIAGRPHEYVARATVETFLANERQFGITDRRRYDAFTDRVHRNKKALITLVERLRQHGHVIWAYGASAKGNTLMSAFGLSREFVPVAIDDNPKKWGFYTPGAHMRIAGINELATAKVDYLLLLAWNFKAEIMKRCQAAGYAGGFIIPVPTPEVIDAMRNEAGNRPVCNR